MNIFPAILEIFRNFVTGECVCVRGSVNLLTSSYEWL